MKNIFLSLLLAGTAMAAMSSCKKNDDSSGRTESTTPLTTEQKLERKWKLTDFVNISDEEKYLNALLELKADQSYSNTGNDQVKVKSGKWSVVPDSLFLDSGLFSSGDASRFRITLLNESSLNLSEHYTKDGKDAIIEYHYSAN